MRKSAGGQDRRFAAHRILYYIEKKTSAKKPEWRDAAIGFLYGLYESIARNPGLNCLVYYTDGIRLFYKDKQIAYFHLQSRHLLIHANHDYLLWPKGDGLFGRDARVEGAYDRMWRVKERKSLSVLLDWLQKLPLITLPPMNKKGRAIPAWVKELVRERDNGKCVACGATESLHFDHILPFSMGGSSVHPDNIQLLCDKHNHEKSATFRY